MTRNSIAFLLGLFLIALILLTSPSTSLEVLIKGLSGKYTKGTIINFSVEANISSSEHIPVNFIILNITGPSSYGCKIYMNNTVEGCPFLTVSSIDYDFYGYGYGYGYDNGYHYLGYGYGYGPNKIRINLVMKTIDFNGLYNVKAAINAGISPNIYIFSSPVYSFLIEEQQNISFSSRASGPTKYFLEILDIKGKNNNYTVRVRNGGTENLKVYLILELPQNNQTYQPIILNSGEETLLNYTLIDGSYNYRVVVVGEADNLKLTKYINMMKNEEKVINEINETENRQISEENIPEKQKSQITGLITGILASNKYKLIVALSIFTFVSIFIFVKFRV